jgi:hypothetical protein
VHSLSTRVEMSNTSSVLAGRGLHSLTSKLNLRIFGNTSLTFELNLSTFGTHPQVKLGDMGDKVTLS